MDYGFSEDAFEVGAETDAYCNVCKSDTTHTVVSKFEGEVRSVQCTICHSTHNYRAPRTEVDDDVPEPISVKRRLTRQRPNWADAMQQVNHAAARRYAIYGQYVEGEVIQHPTFGVGYISELVSESKMEAIFRDGTRILAYNRKDLLPAALSAAKKKGGASGATASEGPPVLLRLSSGDEGTKGAKRGRRGGKVAKAVMKPVPEVADLDEVFEDDLAVVDVEGLDEDTPPLESATDKKASDKKLVKAAPKPKSAAAPKKPEADVATPGKKPVKSAPAAKSKPASAKADKKLATSKPARAKPAKQKVAAPKAVAKKSGGAKVATKKSAAAKSSAAKPAKKKKSAPLKKKAASKKASAPKPKVSGGAAKAKNSKKTKATSKTSRKK